jgi:3-dehydroquinate synthase
MYRVDPLIYIGENILPHVLPYIAGQQVCIVTQEEIPGGILNKLQNLLADKVVKIVYVPDGEAAKSWPVVEQVIDKLVAAKFNRECTVIALGGGVVGDLAGFVASIYLRGVNFIQLPTTLLAQVDASVGGKTAINHALGKNLIGSFYPAKAVVIDVNSLHTLSQRHFIAGFAEVVKIACVRDAEFFTWLEKNAAALLTRDVEAIKEMIYRAVKLKSEIVKADEKEQGERMLLNFGHTLAHAIESASDYFWLHGEAVAVGMMQAAKMSQQYGLAPDVVERISKLLQAFGLPTQLPATLAEHCQEYMAQDKKHRDAGLNWVLLENLGAGKIKNIKKQELKNNISLAKEI